MAKVVVCFESDSDGGRVVDSRDPFPGKRVYGSKARTVTIEVPDGQLDSAMTLAPLDLFQRAKDETDGYRVVSDSNLDGLQPPGEPV